MRGKKNKYIKIYKQNIASILENNIQINIGNGIYTKNGTDYFNNLETTDEITECNEYFKEIVEILKEYKIKDIFICKGMIVDQQTNSADVYSEDEKDCLKIINKDSESKGSLSFLIHPLDKDKVTLGLPEVKIPDKKQMPMTEFFLKFKEFVKNIKDRQDDLEISNKNKEEDKEEDEKEEKNKIEINNKKEDEKVKTNDDILKYINDNETTKVSKNARKNKKKIKKKEEREKKQINNAAMSQVVHDIIDNVVDQAEIFDLGHYIHNNNNISKIKPNLSEEWIEKLDEDLKKDQKKGKKGNEEDKKEEKENNQDAKLSKKSINKKKKGQGKGGK